MSLDPALAALVARRRRIALALTAVMVVTYFAFVALVAFAKDSAGALVAGDRVSVGILLGAGLVVLAPLLTVIYVRWANRHYDPAIAAARKPRP